MISFYNPFNRKSLPPPDRTSVYILSTLDQLIGVMSTMNLSINSLIKGIATMDQRIADLSAAVAAESTAVSGAITLLNGITDRITDAVNAALNANPGTDLSPLIDITNSIKQETQALAAAVASVPGNVVSTGTASSVETASAAVDPVDKTETP